MRERYVLESMRYKQ